jgi:hypothetical protein
MDKWVTEKLIDILGFEDDIVINLVINMLHSKVKYILNYFNLTSKNIPITGDRTKETSARHHRIFSQESRSIHGRAMGIACRCSKSTIRNPINIHPKEERRNQSQTAVLSSPSHPTTIDYHSRQHFIANI